MNPGRKSLVKITLFSFFISTLSWRCGKEITEIEPANNSAPGAATLAPKEEFTGSFFSASGVDIDFIFIPAQKKQVLTATLSPAKGIDSKILIFNQLSSVPSKTINDNLSSLPEKIGPYPVSPPGVWVAIAPSSPVNSAEYKENHLYTFSYRLHPAPDHLESEPNDSIAQANLLTDGVISGYYTNLLTGEGVEKDFYAVDFSEEDRTVMSVKLGAVEEIDAVLRVHNSAGDVLAVVDQGGPGDPENLPFYGITSQRIYLSVSAKNNSQTKPAPYRLEVTTSDFDPQLEFEPNDTPDRAHVLSVSETRAGFSSDRDVDYYLVENDQNFEQNLELTFTPVGMTNPAVELFSGGTSLLQADDGARGEPEIVRNFRIAPRGSLLAKVSLAPGAPASGEDPGYKVTLVLSPALSTVEAEPNDTPGRANELKPGMTINGHLSPYDDVDHYRVMTTGQKRYNIELSGVEGCQWKLEILNSQKYVTSSFLGDKPGEGILHPAILSPGSLLRLFCHNKEKNLYMKPYSLTIKSAGSSPEEP